MENLNEDRVIAAMSLQQACTSCAALYRLLAVADMTTEQLKFIGASDDVNQSISNGAVNTILGTVTDEQKDNSANLFVNLLITAVDLLHSRNPKLYTRLEADVLQSCMCVIKQYIGGAVNA